MIMNNDNSSTDSDSVVDEADEGYSQRTKRSVGGTEWCGTSDESPPPRAHVEWPPVEGHTTDLRNSFTGSSFNMGNPNFSQTMQLFSRTNHFLAAYPDGTVRGTQDSSDIHTILEISNAGQTGHVRIMCLLSRVYVAIDKRGNLYAENNMWIEGTVWIESYRGGYNTYLSRQHAHKKWYLGLKKSGKVKRGPKTAEKQKAVQFLPVRRGR